MLRTLLALSWIPLIPALAAGQSARVVVAEEEFRATAGGKPLATVRKDAGLRLGERQGTWREATLEGWVWSASLAAERRDGHDLVVSARGGENLRAAPNGAILARLRVGMLITEVERQGSWVRVRRTGWLRDASLATDADAPTTEVRSAPAAAAAQDPPAKAASQPAPTASPPGRAWTRIGQAGAALLATQGSDTLAALRPLAEVEVVAREGTWARVRLEGRVWAPAIAAPADTGAILKDVSPLALAANPAGFQGRIVEWAVQFIALERAEKVRTDFYEGEPFILARAPGEEAGFVYIAVPPQHLAQVERLAPLQRLTILGRIRAARSPIMGAPVLDLLEIR